MSVEERPADSPRNDSAWKRLRRTIESRVVRIVLAVAIVISLLPYESMEAVLAAPLLLLFGTEFVLRVHPYRKH